MIGWMLANRFMFALGLLPILFTVAISLLSEGDVGEGVYASYLFTLVWLLDVLWYHRKVSQEHRYLTGVDLPLSMSIAAMNIWLSFPCWKPKR